MNRKRLWKTLLATAAAQTLLTAAGCASGGLPPLTANQKALAAAVVSPDPAADIPGAVRACGGNVNFQLPENGRTVLTLAVIQQDEKRTLFLLHSHADTEIPDENGMTALHYAAEHSSKALCTILLRAGAKPDTPDTLGKTPLMNACRLGNLEIARVLMKAGADPAARDLRGRTAAIFAATAPGPGSALALLRFLKDSDALFPAADGDGNTPLTAAIDAGNTDAALFLLERFPEDLSSTPAGTLVALLAMKHAVFAGDETLVRELIRRKTPLNTTLPFAYRALKKIELQNVFKSMADSHLIPDGRVPLSWAAEKDNVKLILLLLQAGADPLCKDNCGNLPVDYTRKRESLRVLEKAMKKQIKQWSARPETR